MTEANWNETIQEMVAAPPPPVAQPPLEENGKFLESFTPGAPKLAVYFDFVLPNGQAGSTRTFLEGITALSTAAELTGAEEHIKKYHPAGFVSVLITNWITLQG